MPGQWRPINNIVTEKVAARVVKGKKGAEGGKDARGCGSLGSGCPRKRY